MAYFVKITLRFAVEIVFKDHPIGHTNVVHQARQHDQEKWSLVTGSIA